MNNSNHSLSLQNRTKLRANRDGRRESVDETAHSENKGSSRERCERRATWTDIESRLYAGEQVTTSNECHIDYLAFTYRSFFFLKTSAPVYLARL